MIFRNSLAVLLFVACCCAVSAAAYQPSSRRGPPPPAAARAASAAAAAALSVLLSTGSLPAAGSDMAAQISLDRLPPTSISIQIGDLPVIGSLLSGTYSKVADGSITNPSVTITSPKDKVRAISSIATGGHLEFDVGGMLSTHLDVDVAADEAGTARVVVKSGLIPRLPFKNMASASSSASSSTAKSSPIVGGKESPWNIVTNLGNGESYYYNLKSGVTQFDRPNKL